MNNIKILNEWYSSLYEDWSTNTKIINQLIQRVNDYSNNDDKDFGKQFVDRLIYLNRNHLLPDGFDASPYAVSNKPQYSIENLINIVKDSNEKNR